MFAVLSGCAFVAVGLVMIMSRDAEPFYARPVQSTPARRLGGGIALIAIGIVIAVFGSRLARI